MNELLDKETILSLLDIKNDFLHKAIDIAENLTKPYRDKISGYPKKHDRESVVGELFRIEYFLKYSLGRVVELIDLQKYEYKNPAFLEIYNEERQKDYEEVYNGTRDKIEDEAIRRKI